MYMYVYEYVYEYEFMNMYLVYVYVFPELGQILARCYLGTYMNINMYIWSAYCSYISYVLSKLLLMFFFANV